MKKMASTASAEANALSSLFAALLVLVLVSSSANGGSVNDCHGVRYAYRERGLDLKDVPRQPRQGKVLAQVWSITNKLTRTRTLSGLA